MAKSTIRDLPDELQIMIMKCLLLDQPAMIVTVQRVLSTSRMAKSTIHPQSTNSLILVNKGFRQIFEEQRAKWANYILQLNYGHINIDQNDPFNANTINQDTAQWAQLLVPTGVRRLQLIVSMPQMQNTGFRPFDQTVLPALAAAMRFFPHAEAVYITFRYPLSTKPQLNKNQLFFGFGRRLRSMPKLATYRITAAICHGDTEKLLDEYEHTAALKASRWRIVTQRLTFTAETRGFARRTGRLGT